MPHEKRGKKIYIYPEKSIKYLNKKREIKIFTLPFPVLHYSNVTRTLKFLYQLFQKHRQFIHQLLINRH